ncbi:MAG: hypothetical protein FJ104_06740 [Deltaproteobacteria bacterium]|nr:hypothetical protein [Deltaproteobacteria bacterium]
MPDVAGSRTRSAPDPKSVGGNELSDADRRFLDYLAEIALQIALNDPKMGDSMNDPEGSRKP